VGTTSNASILAPVSVGELLDKITILQIKTERIRAPEKRALAAQELEELNHTRELHVAHSDEVARHVDELKLVNEALWEIEDGIRLKEKAAEFDGEFIALARSVYRTNDRRAEIKRTLNTLLGSTIVEVKEYDEY
jgi:uncharacterized small protein (DUF1192 family)